MSKPLFSVFRVPRTGSTLAKRALQVVATFPPGECSHDPFTPTAPLIITIRDWRDVLYSQWRIRFGGKHERPNIAQLRLAMEVVDKRLGQLARMCDATPEFHEWRYEGTYKDVGAVARKLYALTGEWPDAPDMVQITEAVLPARAMSVQKTVEPSPTGRDFDAFDAATGIHRDHIGPQRGRPGAWRQVIPSEYHDEINEHYSDALTRWNYQE